jgi:hypothetical protein
MPFEQPLCCGQIIPHFFDICLAPSTRGVMFQRLQQMLQLRGLGCDGACWITTFARTIAASKHAAIVAKKLQFLRCAVGAGQLSLQKIPVEATPTKA